MCVCVCLSLSLKLVKCSFTSTETVDLFGTGAKDVHLDFHTAPELCLSLSPLVFDDNFDGIGDNLHWPFYSVRAGNGKCLRW